MDNYNAPMFIYKFADDDDDDAFMQLTNHKPHGFWIERCPRPCRKITSTECETVIKCPALQNDSTLNCRQWKYML